MKKGLFCILFLVSFVVFGQCPNNNITLQTQAQIDEFAITYPGCTEFSMIHITGSLNDIFNLEGLSQIEIITGELIITDTKIQNLNGLENLEFVGFRLNINNNQFLQNFQGINQLETVGSGLLIHSNSSLENLSGFDSLTSLGEDTPWFVGLYLQNNESLMSLSGLEDLTQISGDVIIQGNDLIEDFSGLSGLIHVYGGIEISYNDNIQNFNGLEALESIEGTLNIVGNDNLQSLGKLESLDPQTIAEDGYFIQDNPNLWVCDIDFICQNLNYPGVQVNDNAPGCNTISEIQYECSVVDFTDPLFKTAVINHNPIIDIDSDGEIQYTEAESFNGTLEVSNKNISSFGGLEAFINITGLNVSQNSMSFLDLSSNIAIESIIFSNNTLLQNVNLRNGNNTAIQNFQGINCPNLIYICVDDAIYATNYFVEIDPQVIFTEDCTLSITEFVLTENIKLFPNPFSSILIIETSKTISFEKATVYSVLGNQILETSEKQINLESLSADIYCVKVETDKGSVTRKIVKQ